MTTRPTTRHRGHAGARPIARATLFGAALALAASPFVAPATARADFNQQFYQFCITNLGQGNDYCCAHSGGAVKGGGCLDPASGNITSPAAVVRQG